MASMALTRTRGLRQELEKLKFEVVGLRRDLANNAVQPPAREKQTAAPTAGERVVAPEPRPIETPSVAKQSEPPGQTVPPPAPVEEPVVAINGAATDWAKTSASIERMVAANWLVWVGGAALALGGIFLVRFAWEQGYFGPLARTIAATLAGVAMIAASEWLRRRVPADAEGQISRAPLLVAAAGAVTLYGAVYAAGPLYHLIPPELTLVGFVLASAIAVGLAVIHGISLAALGLTGGYVAPLLVGGGAPEPVLLLTYATVVTLACLVLVRAFGWGRIVWIALAGAGMWMVLGVMMSGLANTPVAITGYAIVLVIAATAFAWSDADAAIIRHRGEAAHPSPNQTLVAAIGFWIVAGVGLLMATLATDWWRRDPLLIALALYGAAAILAGWRKPAFEIAPVFGMAAFLIGLLLVPVDRVVPGVYGPDGVLLQSFGEPAFDTYRFAAFALTGALASGLGGWFAMRTLRHPTLMAVVSAFTPLGLLLIAFHQLGVDQQHFTWGLAGGLLAMLNLLALEGMRRSARGLDGAKAAASAYALAAFAASMFAVGASLGEMWMTVMLAAHLPAIAMIDRRFNLPALRLCASVAALVVSARLLWPQEILSYQLSSTPLLNELVLLYGLPIACFWGAARLFAVNPKSAAAPLVEALDVGALVLVTVLVGLEVRHAVTGGDLATGAPGLVEMSAYTVAFTALALGLDARRGSEQRPLMAVAVDGIYILAAVAAVLGLGLLANPLLSGWGGRSVIDGPPLLNLLASSYLPPVAVFGVHSMLARRQGRMLAGNASGFIALALVFLYLSLEVRNAFHVDLWLQAGPITEPESYAYSITWLLFAVAILIVGMARRSVAIRHAAMAVLALSVAKVFVLDMAALTGVLRAASFMGLGVALIGIAYLYQRVVFRREAP
jgi:uncharacterized membrane protein